MDFLDSIQNQSLATVKQVFESKNISTDDNWLDYKALNKALEHGRKDVAMYFLSKNFRVNNNASSDTLTITPLHYAVKLGDAELVQQLLEKKASITARNFETNTPLHLAFVLKLEAIVDIILSNMEKTLSYVNCKNNQGLAHLHVASTRKNEKVIEGLLKAGASVEDKVRDESFVWAGYTAMHFAVEFRSLQAVKVLANISSNSELVVKDNSSQTPLQLLNENLEELLIMAYHLERKDTNVHNRVLSYFNVACLRKDQKLMKKFIENGADVNDAVISCGPIGSIGTPLHLAVENESKENVDLLLQYEAKIDCTNSSKMMPLHLAIYIENSEIVDSLYAALPNKEENLTDANNLSIFHIAVVTNDMTTVKKYLDKNIDLVNSKVLTNSYGFSNFTPLHFAVVCEHLETAKLLIEHGADVNANDDGCRGTPLHIACFSGNTDLVELLLKNNADVKVLENNKRTPLHDLITNERYGNINELFLYVDQLVKLGCDINAQNKDGDTALHYLWSDEERYSIVCLFLELGANVNIENAEGRLPLNENNYKKENVNTKVYASFYDHLQNLKALSMEVHSKNLELCKLMLKDKTSDAVCFSNEEISRKQKQRLNEISKMKNTMLTDHLRFYDFMLFDPRRAAAYVNNDVLKIILDDKDFKVQYPTYYYLIRLQQQKGENFGKS